MKCPAFFRSFGYAAKGVCAALREERNMRFHLCAALYVYIASAFMGFSTVEYALLTILVCGVMALELVNSAVERAVAAPDSAHWLAAGAAKDMAAGAVLVFSIGAAVCGVLLFWRPARLLAMGGWFLAHLPLLLLLCASLPAAWIFVFRPPWNQKKKG